MAFTNDVEKHRLNKELYAAVMKGDEKKVIELCGEIPEGPLHIITIQNDTVLHMATYSKQTDLVLNLLKELTRDQYDKLTHQNDSGNTILHEAATSNKIVPAAQEMLRIAPQLLSMQNFNGETALFRAACYGKSDMFWFLDDEVNKIFTTEADRKPFYQRKDGTTIFHIATLTEHFVPSCCRVPLWEAIWKKNQTCESALRLAKFLIERDLSWELTESAMDQSKPKIHKYGESFTASQDEGIGRSQSAPTSQENHVVKMAKTPLFLATKLGCREIVEEILKMYPQAVEHIDNDGRNILHVAIKYRQIEIFDIVEKMEIPMRRLVRKTDDNGNSILHMRVEKMLTTHFIKHLNLKGETAQELFAKHNAELRKEAKKWLKSTAENCSIVAVLIATVAFTSAYTIPGGPNQSTGYPILLDEPFFVVFTITDVLSLAFALTSVITFLSILTSPFQLRDFKRSLPQRLMLGVTLLIFSVSMMMLAFGATIILMIRNRQLWTKFALYAVAFLPVTIFALSYLPLYLSLVKNFRYSFKKIGQAFPRCSSAPLNSWITKSVNCRNSQVTGSTSSTGLATPKTCPISCLKGLMESHVHGEIN
ncbi:hypothetical protein F0562_014404 [Nyssa sinensis]|uniref:PGG domain-containing protein n=1 Tax=Nyssa sinensis TaxID=561372 RepID=A0A5J4ZR13_9ASTE|nr:hypothetical protein F0562_014404 [Nyssa sinensis]